MNRRLRMEMLEDRSLLSTVTVTNNLDVSNGDTSSIANLQSNDGGDGIALREAIQAANNTAGADIVDFDTQGLFATPQLISLGGTEMAILESLTISGPGQAGLTIDGQEASRIFDVTASGGDFTFSGLTLMDGRTVDVGVAGAGGTIRSLTSGHIAIDDSTIVGSTTLGNNANGGAIFSLGAITLSGTTLDSNRATGNAAFGGGIAASENVTLVNSTVKNNSTVCGSGGGIFSLRDVILNGSTVSDNSTACVGSFGGGISASRDVVATSSTVSGNSTTGTGSRGGGIASSRDVMLIDSTVSGNRTTGSNALGGGIASYRNITVTQSTVSGNSTSQSNADGGGIHSFGDVTITHSTVTGNHASHNLATGGGIWNDDNPMVIVHSIIAGNLDGGGNPDLRPGTGSLTIEYSLIGDNAGTTLAEAQTPNVQGNLIGSAAGGGIIDPGLLELADNGGPTQTHAMKVGSPATDAGDPSILFDENQYDQRADTFPRVANGRIDVGAVEQQPSDLGVGLFIVDFTTHQSYRYDLDANLLGNRALDAANTLPRASTAAADGSKFWVVDTNQTIYVYSPSGGLVGQWSTTAIVNPEGIATDGVGIWIVSRTTDRVYYFADGASLTSGNHEPTSSFPLNSLNAFPFGIATDGSSLWVVNDATDLWRVFKYDLTGTLLGSWDLDALNKNARGITLDPSHPDDLLVLDAGRNMVFRYADALDQISGSLAIAESLPLTTTSSAPQGIAAFATNQYSSADFDADGDVDGADFLTWQRGFGSADVPKSQGDANKDGNVNAADFVQWSSTYGEQDAADTFHFAAVVDEGGEKLAGQGDSGPVAWHAVESNAPVAAPPEPFSQQTSDDVAMTSSVEAFKAVSAADVASVREYLGRDATGSDWPTAPASQSHADELPFDYVPWTQSHANFRTAVKDQALTDSDLGWSDATILQFAHEDGEVDQWLSDDVLERVFG